MSANDIAGIIIVGAIALAIIIRIIGTIVVEHAQAKYGNHDVD